MLRVMVLMLAVALAGGGCAAKLTKINMPRPPDECKKKLAALPKYPRGKTTDVQIAVWLAKLRAAYGQATRDYEVCAAYARRTYGTMRDK